MEPEGALLSSLEADTGPEPDKNPVYIITNSRFTDHFNTLPPHI
jgi:hypothetical protein